MNALDPQSQRVQREVRNCPLIRWANQAGLRESVGADERRVKPNRGGQDGGERCADGAKIYVALRATNLRT
jgi:hypothetical protein